MSSIGAIACPNSLILEFGNRLAILVVLCASKFADCCVLKVHNLLSNNNILRVWPQYTLESIKNIFNNKKYKSTKFCYIKPCHKKHMSIQHLWESLQSTSYIQAKYINIIYISFLQVAYCTKTYMSKTNKVKTFVFYQAFPSFLKQYLNVLATIIQFCVMRHFRFSYIHFSYLPCRKKWPKQNKPRHQDPS